MTYAKFKDIDNFGNWYLKREWLRTKTDFNQLMRAENVEPALIRTIERLFDKQSKNLFQQCYFESEKRSDEDLLASWMNSCGKDSINNLKIMANNLERHGQQFYVLHIIGDFAVIGTSSDYGMFLVPNYNQHLDICKSTDYSNVPIEKIKALSSTKGGIIGNLTVAADGHDNLTIKSLKQQEADIKDKISQVEKYQTEELAQLKAKIEAEEKALWQRKQDMIATMNGIKEKLEDGMRGMQKQIFFLETEIYGIQCYLGETISFTKLRSGTPAPASQPALLMQKVRFLDEELGRMVSLYDFDGNDEKLFEDLLANRQDIMEYFCPSNKSVSLFRVSKSAKSFGMHERFANMLAEYEVYHGKQIGILIRNGENLYAGWTESDYVNFPDDFFLTPGEQIIEEPKQDFFHREPNKKEIFLKQMGAAQEAASRYFLFNILQGAIDAEKPLLSFDEKIILNKPSSKIIFSTADNWLEDNSYGQFSDIVTRCNAATKLGDDILMMQRLIPAFNSQCRVNNDRGRGYSDRTHDCSVQDCEAYKINLIDITRRRYFCWLEDGKNPERGYSYRTETKERDSIPDAGTRIGKETFVKEVIEETNHYFISTKKRYSSSGARSNFEVYAKEFMNLTYMNSKWLKYIITTKKVNGWEIGGKLVTYAYLIPYLNKALELIKTRELEEELLIRTHCDNKALPDDWMVSLSEWKLATGVRIVTDFQAKRFAKALL